MSACWPAMFTNSAHIYIILTTQVLCASSNYCYCLYCCFLHVRGNKAKQINNLKKKSRKSRWRCKFRLIYNIYYIKYKYLNVVKYSRVALHYFRWRWALWIQRQYKLLFINNNLNYSHATHFMVGLLSRITYC